jgi:hypothetical protein
VFVPLCAIVLAALSLASLLGRAYQRSIVKDSLTAAVCESGVRISYKLTFRGRRFVDSILIHLAFCDTKNLQRLLQFYYIITCLVGHLRKADRPSRSHLASRQRRPIALPPPTCKSTIPSNKLPTTVTMMIRTTTTNKSSQGYLNGDCGDVDPRLFVIRTFW